MRPIPLFALLVLASFLTPAAAQSAKEKEREKEALAIARQQLRNQQEAPRQQGARTCLAFNSVGAIEVLLDAFDGPNPHTRDIVWEVLPQFTNPAARKRVAEELKDNKKNAGVRQWCAELLGRYGDPSLASPLERALADEEIAVRRAAARALGRLKHAPAAAKLDAIARKPGSDPYLRANAIEALARIDPEKYAPLYAEGLADPDGGVRCALLGALPEIDPGRVESASAAALEDRDWRPRLQAVDNLAAVKKSPGAVDSLVRATHDERPAVSERAIAALRKVTKQNWTLAPQWSEWWSANRETFVFPEEPAPKTEEELAKEAAEKPAPAEAPAPGEAPATGEPPALGEKAEPAAPAAVDSSRSTYATYNGITVQSDHVAFLIDKSRDMESTLRKESRVKADVALGELDATLSRLPRGVLFNVFTYADEIEPLRKQPLELDEKSHKSALSFVKKAEHEGQKDIWLALSTVVEDPTLDTIFLLSSGEPDIGLYVHWNRVTEQLKELNRFHKVVIHTVAYSDSQWNRDQLQKISEATGGQFVYKE